MPESSHHSSANTVEDVEATPLIYAIGDIHGSLQKLRDLMTQCQRHADGAPATFVFLGDYIDRGPDSRGVIETLMDLQSRHHDRVVALKGNHEAVALEIIDGETEVEHWLQEGGVATLRSYNAEHPRDLPDEHITWLRSLPFFYDYGRRFFVHAGVGPAQTRSARTILFGSESRFCRTRAITSF